jgi:hypothetical protein
VLLNHRAAARSDELPVPREVSWKAARFHRVSSMPWAGGGQRLLDGPPATDPPARARRRPCGGSSLVQAPVKLPSGVGTAGASSLRTRGPPPFPMNTGRERRNGASDRRSAGIKGFSLQKGEGMVKVRDGSSVSFPRKGLLYPLSACRGRGAKGHDLVARCGGPVPEAVVFGQQLPGRVVAGGRGHRPFSVRCVVRGIRDVTPEPVSICPETVGSRSA